MLTDEMKKQFEIRTEKHRDLYKKYAKKINEKNSLLNLKIYTHDLSKYQDPEHIPYVYLNWYYRCKRLNIPYEIPEYINTAKATIHHIMTNEHHPEYWDNTFDKNSEYEFKSNNRDNVDKKIVDATKMPKSAICMMCADWMAMSEEKHTDPIEWADININIRWKFDDWQVESIYEILKIYKEE